MTRIKICGITRIEDALAAANAGADAIGLVFYESSPRNVTIQQAKQICEALPPFVTTVGLFVNAEAKFTSDILNQVPLDLLQFHGEESASYCEQFNRPWIKALRVHPDAHILEQINNYPNAQGILLDSYVAGVQGGTGITFDWSIIPQSMSKPIILAGGLNLDNIQQAIKIAKPYAVDVSGGVETSKGIKDVSKIKAFIEKVNSCL